MPTDDRQVLVAGTAPAPADFKIPGNGQIQPKAINAVFNGSGAASSFAPTLEIVSDAGIVVARCPAPTVAAGGSAEVSWFPHVAAGGGTATGLDIPWCEAENNANPSLASGVSTYVPLPAGDFVDSGTGIYQTVIGAGGQQTVKITAEGVYVAICNLGLNTTATIPGPGAACYFNFQGGFYQLGTSTPAPFVLNPVTLQYGASAWTTAMFNLVPSYGNIPSIVNLIANQTSGALLNYAPQLLIYQLNTKGNSGF